MKLAVSQLNRSQSYAKWFLVCVYIDSRDASRDSGAAILEQGILSGFFNRVAKNSADQVAKRTEKAGRMAAGARNLRESLKDFPARVLYFEDEAKHATDQVS